MRVPNACLALMLIASGVAYPQSPATPDAQRVRDAITQLGELNGQALACSLPDSASAARALMLQHSPRTPEFGALFEKSTEAGYSGQLTHRSPCPSATELTVRLEVIAVALRELLPAGGG